MLNKALLSRNDLEMSTLCNHELEIHSKVENLQQLSRNCEDAILFLYKSVGATEKRSKGASLSQ